MHQWHQTTKTKGDGVVSGSRNYDRQDNPLMSILHQPENRFKNKETGQNWKNLTGLSCSWSRTGAAAELWSFSPRVALILALLDFTKQRWFFPLKEGHTEKLRKRALWWLPKAKLTGLEGQETNEFSEDAMTAELWICLKSGTLGKKRAVSVHLLGLVNWVDYILPFPLYLIIMSVCLWSGLAGKKVVEKLKSRPRWFP